jgi:hypothetical protein
MTVPSQMMTRRPPSELSDPDLLRRLREFQGRVRTPVRRVEAVVPARGPISSRVAYILDRLRKLEGSLADSFEQALQDLNDHTRLSYIGPSGEVREVLRATVQKLAPDDEVRAQPWFVGIQQGGKTNPSQAERTRLAVQKRGGSKDQVKGLDDLIDMLVGQIGRQTYSAGSSALHAGAARDKARKLIGWVWALLDEVLPE